MFAKAVVVQVLEQGLSGFCNNDMEDARNDADHLPLPVERDCNMEGGALTKGSR